MRTLIAFLAVAAVAAAQVTGGSGGGGGGGGAVTQSGVWSTRTQDGSGNGITSRAAGSSRPVDVVQIDALGSPLPQIVGAAPGATTVMPLGVFDGGAIRRALSDASGRMRVVGAASSGAAVAGDPVLVGGSDGANARTLSVDSLGRIALPVFGTVAPGVAATSSMLGGGVYNSTLPTLTDGQQAAVQMGSTGKVLAAIGDDTRTVTVKGGFSAVNGSENALVVRLDGSLSVPLAVTTGDLTGAGAATGALNNNILNATAGSSGISIDASGSLTGGGWFQVVIVGGAGITAGAITFKTSHLNTLASAVDIVVNEVTNPEAPTRITGPVTIAANTTRVFAGYTNRPWLFATISTAFTGGTVTSFYRMGRYVMPGAIAPARLGSNGPASDTVCDQSAAVDLSGVAAGSTLLVAGSAGKRVRVCNLNVGLGAGNTANVRLVSGTGTACGTGTTNLTGPVPAPSAWSIPALPNAVISATTGHDVCIVGSGAAFPAVAGGIVSYAIY